MEASINPNPNLCIAGASALLSVVGTCPAGVRASTLKDVEVVCVVEQTGKPASSCTTVRLYEMKCWLGLERAASARGELSAVPSVWCHPCRHSREQCAQTWPDALSLTKGQGGA